MRIKFLAVLAVLIIASPAIAQFSKSTMQGQINSQFPDQTTGQITPATTRAFLANLLNSYQQYAGLNKQLGASYIVQASDYGQIVTFNNLTTVNVALTPANIFTTFNFFAQNISTGNVVVTPTGGSRICGSTSLTLANTQSAWIVSDGTDWQCQFNLAGTQLTTPLSIANGGTNAATASGTSLDNITGFSSTGFLVRSGAGTYAFQSTAGGLTLSNIGSFAPLSTICNVSTGNATATMCNGGQMSAILCTPTVINFTTASNTTFNTPTCNGVRATSLDIEMVGGGGGGGGSGTAAGTATGNGTASCWKTSGIACNTPDFTANGGAGGPVAGTTTSPAGGTSANCDINLTGASAGPSGATALVGLSGMYGGSSFFGGAGAGAPATGALAGGAAAANTGSGGGGGGGGGALAELQGSGGAAGGYCRKLLLSPAASYSITVGTKGAGGGAGANGGAGGDGANGIIIITGRWQ